MDLLNAQGRHRLGHSIQSGRRFSASICSTPKGVIVWGTAGPGDVGKGHVLLNAQGRHRLGHIERLHEGDTAFGCSTPKGVIVWGTA